MDRRTGLTSLCLFATCIGAAFGQSDPDLERARRVSGRLTTDPLALDARGASHDLEAFRPALASYEEGRRVRGWAAQGRVVALEARTLADVTLLDGVGLGAEGIAALGMHTEVAVLPQHQVANPGERVWLRVLVEGRPGWLPAQHLQVGTDSRVGELAGAVLAPVFGLGSRARGARFFHPEGHVYSARVRSLEPAAFQATAARLEGAALIRLGLGFNRLTDPEAEPLFDALSLAIRFTDPAHGVTTEVHEGDQDLLVTAWAERFHHFFWRVLRKGETKDFLANDYFPAMPFEAEGQDVWIRVAPSDRSYRSRGRGRIERLDNAIADGAGRFELAVQRKGEEAWTPLVELELIGRVEVDQDALHYHPGLAGAGLQPKGWVAAARGAVYRSSQDNRPQPEDARGLAGAVEEAGR